MTQITKERQITPWKTTYGVQNELGLWLGRGLPFPTEKTLSWLDKLPCNDLCSQAHCFLFLISDLQVAGDKQAPDSPQVLTLYRLHPLRGIAKGDSTKRGHESHFSNC